MSIQETAFFRTNEKGKKFIRTWIKEPIEEIHLTPGNWFIVLTEKYGYSLPYNNSANASPSHYGTIDYTKKHLQREEEKQTKTP